MLGSAAAGLGTACARLPWACAGVLAGCGAGVDADHRGTDAPQAAPLARVPRVAWVLSSGGPRGFVHVGVLQALDELGLEPDVIVGTSVGALIGVLRAAGVRGRALVDLALDLQPWTLARLAPGAAERWWGGAIADFVRRHAPAPLEVLARPAVCVAQRLPSGDVVGFTRGDAGLAVQASVAIVGQFAPLRIRGDRYADADLRMPLPVRLARGLGAVRVVAVDASAHEERAPPGAEEWRESDRRKRALTRPDAEQADVLLHPDFGYWAGLSRDYRLRAIRSGHAETLRMADRLRALHAR